jgi:hypothetical protein
MRNTILVDSDYLQAGSKESRMEFARNFMIFHSGKKYFCIKIQFQHDVSKKQRVLSILYEIILPNMNAGRKMN